MSMMKQITKNNFYPGDIPSEPGIYLFRDAFGKIIYIGKAKNLRKRVSHYFQKSRIKSMDPKLSSLVNSIATCETRSVKNENEALVLESRLIKEYTPYYNVLMRDDKRFLMLKINPSERFPRMDLVRLRRNDGARYYGPFPKGGALRDTVEFFNHYFGLRSCRVEIPMEKDHRHCLRKTIAHCSAPCIGKISEEGYRQKLVSLLGVVEGNSDALICEIREKMHKAAAAKNYEAAAKLRDVISNIDAIFKTANRNFRYASIKSSLGAESVDDLKNALGLEKSPDRIEAFDVSNISGQFAVGSMVSFRNGEADKKNYRRFRIKTVGQPDDFAMMKELVYRRYRRIVDEKAELPDLILVDGGKGQLSMALKALAESGAPPIPMIGLAKRNEEVFIPCESSPLLIEKDRPALKLLQAIRDEAHRFAISYHRELRDRRIQESVLDEIPGIGDERKKQLIQEFGSILEIKKASSEEIARRVPGIGEKTAATIKLRLSAPLKIGLS